MKYSALILAAFAAISLGSPVMPEGQVEKRAGIFGPFGSKAECTSRCKAYPGGGVSAQRLMSPRQFDEADSNISSALAATPISADSEFRSFPYSSFLWVDSDRSIVAALVRRGP